MHGDVVERLHKDGARALTYLAVKRSASAFSAVAKNSSISSGGGILTALQGAVDVAVAEGRQWWCWGSAAATLLDSWSLRSPGARVDGVASPSLLNSENA
jgi:hypothetical protein